MEQPPGIVPEMLKHIYLNTTGLQVVYGDPAEEELDGVVVYLNKSLMPMGQASNGLFRKAGPEITIQCQSESSSRGGVNYGDVLVTSSSHLLCKHLICVICPEDEEEALAALHDSLISALTIASFKGIETVAVPVYIVQSAILSCEKQVELYFHAIQRFISLHNDFRLIRIIGQDVGLANACGHEFNRYFHPRYRGRTAKLKKNSQSTVL